MQKKLKVGWFSFTCCEDSVVGDSLIYAKIDGKLFFGTIEELEKLLRFSSIRNINGKIIMIPKKKLEILSVTGNSKKECKIEWKEVKFFIKHMINKPIFKITLRTNKNIEVTGDHSLFKYKSTSKYTGNYQSDSIEKMIPCKVSELKNGDSIWCVDDFSFDTKDTKINDNLLLLAGLWLAGGCYDYQHGIHISTGNDQDIINFLKQIGSEFKFNLTIRKNGDTTLNSRKFMRKFIFESGFVGKAKEKRLPRWCFLLSNRQIRLLLKGYFSGNGTVERNAVSVSSISLGLLEDLSILLNRIGIVKSISKIISRDVKFNNKIYHTQQLYRLTISKRDSLNKFLDIGFIQKYKMNKLKKYVKFRNKFYGVAAHKIKSIEVRIPKNEFVYDFDVPVTQNFVANGIICHNSTIVFLELMNDRYSKWKNLIEFKYFRTLKSKNDMSDLDVAFVEGAIANYKEEEAVKQIRKNCKKLVAVGSCACTGSPSNQRNFFDEDTRQEIQFVLDRFGHREKVSPISEIVKVDDSIPGCPMSEEIFLQKLDNYLKEFGVVDA